LGVGHPPARADGGKLSHGELRVLSHLSLGFPAMPRTREQRRLKTVGEWGDLPDELLAKVLAKVLEAATQEGGLGFTKPSASLRLVSAQWKTVRDAMVRRLVLKRKATDKGMGVLVRRFPAMVSLEFKWVPGGHALTDKGLRALSSCTALTSLNLTWCYELTDVRDCAACPRSPSSPSAAATT
jgi:hypothetical protein